MRKCNVTKSVTCLLYTFTYEVINYNLTRQHTYKNIGFVAKIVGDDVLCVNLIQTLIFPFIFSYKNKQQNEALGLGDYRILYI